MNKEKTASFIKGFVAVMLVMLLVLAYILIRNIGDDRAKETTTAPTSQTDLYGSEIPPATLAELQGKCDILFGCGENGRVDFLLRTVFDLDEKQVTVTAIPTDLTLSYSGESATVSQVFEKGGASALCAAIGGYYGDSFDRYFFCTPDRFAVLTKRLGTAEIMVKKDISYIREDIVLQLKSGKHSLYGEELYYYLTYSAEGEDLLENQADAFAVMLNAYICLKNIEKGEDLFSTVINYADSNISAYDYMNTRNILTAIASSADIDYRSGGIAVFKGGDAA